MDSVEMDPAACNPSASVQPNYCRFEKPALNLHWEVQFLQRTREGFRVRVAGSDGVESMELDRPQHLEEDAFLEFVDYARSALVSGDDEGDGSDGNGADAPGPSWSWIFSRILKTCIAYSSGVTPAILLSELSHSWSEQQRAGAPKKRPECINQLKLKHRRTKLPNTVSIDSIYEKNFLSLSSVLEAVVVDVFILPGTNIYMLTLGDFWSSNTIDLYLHRRYYDIVNSHNGILKKGREIFLTGCYLRTGNEGPGHPRLLPTEYLVLLLDEEKDDDAILLGAQFCSDSFSSISLEAIDKGISFAFYGRIVSIGSLEIQGHNGGLQRKQVTLLDNDGVELNFLLWGEQVHLANLLSVGSMLALDRPYITRSMDNTIDSNNEFCLEYGSATQLYLVPFIRHEEQICVTLTQNAHQGSRLPATLDPSQGPKVSQVSLPCDSHGSIDFSSYPVRLFVIDLRDKMTNMSLYGVITNITKERSTTELTFSMKIEDNTGAIWAKLHFTKSWSLGRVNVGHTVYITGLACSMNQKKRLEALWFDTFVGAAFFNLSCLPALLNSSCLHKLSSLTALSSHTRSTQICRVWLDQVSHCHVTTRFSHSLCGHAVEEMPTGNFECSFCHYECDGEIVRAFSLKITLADENAKVFATCSGQSAAELLQISPDEFYELPEEEQIMYPSSLENEKFMVAIVNCRIQTDRQSDNLQSNDARWEVTRALKCE